MNEIPAPLSIYVAYHPDSKRAGVLADALHDWFRLKHGQALGEEVEAGLPIWVRVEHRDGSIQPPIRWEEAHLNVLVVLVDDHLVVDDAWWAPLRRLLDDASGHNAAREDAESEHERVLILPAAVDSSAYRLDFVFADRTALPSGQQDDPPEVQARVLRRSTTEAITRALRPRIAAHWAAAEAVPAAELGGPLRVFLSHAKRDGIPLAVAVRDGLSGMSQIRPWLDTNELPWGQPFAHPIEEAARHQTAALVAVVTDTYPSRPWCRHEATLARAPRRRDRTGDSVTTWTVQPTVAVSMGGGTWTRPMPQLAQVPHISFDASADSRRATVEDVVDRLLLETLLVTFYRGYTDELERRFEPLPKGTRLVLLTWVPDAWSMTQLWISEDLRRVRDSASRWIVAYPGHGLRALERQEVQSLFASLVGTPQPPIFVTQERLARMSKLEEVEDLEPPDLGSMMVGMSAGGALEDVGYAGVGAPHVNEMMVRLTRRLLQSRCSVAYGGTLSHREDQSDLTRATIDVAKGWASRSERHGEETSSHTEQPPLVNYVHAFADTPPDLSMQASLVGVCAFRILEPSPALRDAGWEHPVRKAHALSEMRRLSSEESRARVALGGGLHRWSGWLPGIAEEVLCTLKADRLPIVIGSFGGCAGVLARYLADPKEPWPEELTVDWATRYNARFAELIRHPSDVNPVRRFRELEREMKAFRARLHRRRDDNPLTVLLRRLLQTVRPATVLDLVVEALQCVHAEGPSLDVLLPRRSFF